MSVELAKVATVELLHELQRRLRCSEKRETRTVFFGPPGMNVLPTIFSNQYYPLELTIKISKIFQVLVKVPRRL